MLLRSMPGDWSAEEEQHLITQLQMRQAPLCTMPLDSSLHRTVDVRSWKWVHFQALHCTIPYDHTVTVKSLGKFRQRTTRGWNNTMIFAKDPPGSNLCTWLLMRTSIRGPYVENNKIGGIYRLFFWRVLKYGSDPL
jgi:hypothetical protein